MEAVIFFILVIIAVVVKQALFKIKRQKRQDYYRNDYLKSPEWRKKRYLVLKRDNWRCVYCHAKATEVHHKQYAKEIGREPIEWLVSICRPCHERQHK